MPSLALVGHFLQTDMQLLNTKVFSDTCYVPPKYLSHTLGGYAYPGLRTPAVDTDHSWISETE